MKRLWIGVALLAVLLIGGIGSTIAIEHFHHSLAQRLDSTAAAALEEDWPRAQALLRQCRNRWLHCRNFVAAGVSHEPIEEIDNLYDQLDIYLRRRDSMGFALCCRTLRHRTADLGEAQSINWWNLL